MFKILIVDDENLIRYCLSATFRDPSIYVQTAASGEEALRAIRDETFDVCILDLHLPDMSGIDIMKLIRSTKPSTKIIIISGESLTRDARKIVEENALLYLDKPFDLDQVRAAVNMVRDPRQVSSDRTSMNEERRRQIRRTANAQIRYSAVTPSGETKAIDLEATLRDVSDTGMQIFTDHLLQPGWWLMVSDGTQVHQGVVRWSMAGRQNGSFHVGVQISQPVL